MEQELIKEFSKYKKKELYQWLIVSMIHPSNQKFGIRYELLIHTLLAIEEDKFLNEELTKEKFEEFIAWFEKEYSSHFVMMEDFEPFQQTKLIPLFLDGKKYYFFYGSLERPYEVLKQFYDIVFSVEIEELNNIKSDFLFSLQRQTDILIELTNDDEARLEATSMYIPTLEFFNKYKSFFEVQNIDKNYLHNSKKISPVTEIEKMYDFGIDKETDKIDIPQLDIDDIDLDDSLYFYEMGMNNFNGLHTKIADEYFYLPFETHTETFYSIVEHIIYNNQFQSLDMLNNSMHQRMIKMLSYFFGKKQLSMGLMDNAKIVHSKYFDVISQIDKNKTILFKFISHSDDLFNSINNVARQSFEELDSLKQVNELFAFRYLNENGIEVSQVATNISEVKIIIIFEKLTLNYMLNIDEDWKAKNIFIYNSLDITPPTKHINHPAAA